MIGLSCACAILLPSPARAWIFSEHTRITQRALAELDHAPGAIDRGWLAVLEESLQLCADPQHCGPAAPRLAVLPSLAGDHSCTPAELANTLRDAHDPRSWVRGVLAVAARTDRDLDAAGRDADARADIRRRMHVDLQNQDAHYLTRARLDYSHFQLARELSAPKLRGYLQFALASGQQANATATYVNYHIVAVRLAQRARAEHSRPLIAQALLVEFFALHFLEDAFASGHFVGHWGDTPTRLGTHDYYARAGFAVTRWQDPDSLYIAHGDAFLADAELAPAAAAVTQSLLQILDPAQAEAYASASENAFGFAAFDACNDPVVPPGLTPVVDLPALHTVLGYEPIPALRYPPVARIRAEQGFFLGASATAGYDYVLADGHAPQFNAVVRLGYGAAGIIDDALNAQAFFDIGFAGSYLLSSQRRLSIAGVALRLRAPGYFLLVDGVVAIVLAQLLQEHCPGCVRWAAAAGGGGAGRLWKSHALFGTLSWQLSLLRDLSLRLFPTEATRTSYRTEVLLPMITFRNVLPIAGDGVSQSTDVYMDIGPSLTWTSDHPTVVPGIFASIAVAARVFP